LSYDLRNSSIFNARLKVCSDGNNVIAGGSMFQTLRGNVYNDEISYNLTIIMGVVSHSDHRKSWHMTRIMVTVKCK